MSNDLIPPIVVKVGGFLVPSPILPAGQSSTILADGFQYSAAHRLSFVSDNSFSPTLYSARGRQSSCTSTSTARSTYEWTPADNEALKELCDTRPCSTDEEIRPRWRNFSLSSRSSEDATRTTKKAPRDLSHARRQDKDKIYPHLSSSAPTILEKPKSEQSNAKQTLKQRKEQEKAQKEAEKTEKLKAAIAARNEKIDAHDREQRRKQLLKEAKRQAKSNSDSGVTTHTFEPLGHSQVVIRA